MILKIFFFIKGLFLISVNFIGTQINLDKHPVTKDVIFHKNSINYLKENEWRNELTKYQNIRIGHLSEINKIFASSIYHFWENDSFDRFQIYSVYENWIIFSLSYFEYFLFKNNIISKIYFSKLERLTWEKIMEKGIGYCSQISIALHGFLKSRNIDSKLLAFDGHVVVLVNNNIVMDADKNVIIRDFNVNNIPPQIIQSHYKKAGYNNTESFQMEKIYRTKAQLLNIKDYYPKLFLFTFLMNILKWLIPILLISYSIRFKNKNEI